eukprot:3124287-Amphidinium_carterae.1
MLETKTTDCEPFKVNPRVSTVSLRQCSVAPEWFRQLRNSALEHGDDLQLLGARAPSTPPRPVPAPAATAAGGPTWGNTLTRLRRAALRVHPTHDPWVYQ